MENPFENPQDDTDVLVKVSEIKLYLHSWVLSRYSPVFDCMLGGNFKEGISKEIELKGKNAKDIIQMFKMFYPNEDQSIEDSTTTKTLFEFSREYQLKWMGKRIEKYLISKVESLNDKDKMLFIQATEEHKLGALKECLLNSNLKPFIELQSMEEFQLLSQNMQYELAKKSLKTLNSYGHRTEMEILDEIIYDGAPSENQVDISSEDDREEETEEDIFRKNICLRYYLNDSEEDCDSDYYDRFSDEGAYMKHIRSKEKFQNLYKTGGWKKTTNAVNPFKKSDHNSDVIITCGAYKLHLHSFIISKLSPVLKERLVEQSPGKYKDIMLDEEPIHLIEMFKYFYANLYPGFTQNSLFKVLCNLSDKYQLSWLLQHVHNHLLKEFDFDEDRSVMEKIMALHLADVYNWIDLHERIFCMDFGKHSIARFKCHEEFKELKKQTKYRIVRKIMLLKEKIQISTYCYDSDDNLTQSYVIRTIDDFNEETEQNEAKQNTKDVETIFDKIFKDAIKNANESSEKHKTKVKKKESKEKQIENEEANKEAADNGSSNQAETNNDQTKKDKRKENTCEELKEEKESTQMKQLLTNRRSKHEELKIKKKKAKKEEELKKKKEYNAIFKFLDTIFLNAL